MTSLDTSTWYTVQKKGIPFFNSDLYMVSIW